MIHHANADVPRVLIGQQRVRVVDCADENAVQDGQEKLCRDQLPEPALDRLMSGDSVKDAIND